MSEGLPEVNAEESDDPAGDPAGDSAGTATEKDITDANDDAVAAVGAMSGDDLLALGATLVSELGYTTSNDILGRWMAHHVAEVMIEAKQLPAGTLERRDAEERCRRMILDLWGMRHGRPGGWPHPSAVEIVKLLAELPSPEADWWTSQTSIGQLQELHYRILGSITDWLAATTDTSIDETWLKAFGTLLTEDERLILSRVAGASSRSSDMTSGLSSLLMRHGLAHDSLGIADAEGDRDDASTAAAAGHIENDAVDKRAREPDEPWRRARRVDRRPSPAELQKSQTVDISEVSGNAREQLEVLSAAYMDVVASIASVIEAVSARRDASTEHDA